MRLKEKSTNGVKIYIPLILVVLLIGVASWYWYQDYARYITSDDAHIESDNVQISSKVLGRITLLRTVEADTVKKGEILVELDSLDILAQKAQTLAMLVQANSQLEQAKAKYSFDNQNIKVFQVSLEKASQDMDRANLQLSGDIITKEQFDHFQKAFESAKAQLDAARTQIAVSKAQIESANASIGFAEAQINVINTQLSNTILYSPLDGIVAKKWLQVGDIVQPGQAIFSLAGRANRWVVVYLEETKVANIRFGQDVKFTIDAFSEKIFSGKVFSIGASTASQFSLIPANNASGNFTKVTQRIPVKISIDTNDKGDEVKKMAIVPGMSVVVKILKDR